MLPAAALGTRQQPASTTETLKDYWTELAGTKHGAAAAAGARRRREAVAAAVHAADDRPASNGRDAGQTHSTTPTSFLWTLRSQVQQSPCRDSSYYYCWVLSSHLRSSILRILTVSRACVVQQSRRYLTNCD